MTWPQRKSPASSLVRPPLPPLPLNLLSNHNELLAAPGTVGCASAPRALYLECPSPSEYTVGTYTHFLGLLQGRFLSEVLPRLLPILPTLDTISHSLLWASNVTTPYFCTILRC